MDGVIVNTISIIVDKQYNTVDIKIQKNNRVKYYCFVKQNSQNRIMRFLGELTSIFDVNCYAEYVYKIKGE